MTSLLLRCWLCAEIWFRCFPALGASVEQLPDGRILFPSPTTGDTANWEFKPTRWGRYDIEATVSVLAAGPELQVDIAGETMTVRLPANAAGADRTTVRVGRFYLAKAEPLRVSAGPKPGSTAPFTLRGIALHPAPEGEVVVQKPTGEILLRAHDATTHSVTMRYEPATNKNCLGYWVNPADWADWEFTVLKPGAFNVEVWQGCGNGNGGSDVDVEVGGERLSFVVEETGHFQNFVPRRLGRVKLATPGKHTLVIQPQRKQASAVMDVRKVRLVPVGSGAEPAPEPAPGARDFLAARRVVFLGDSITYGGEWVEFVETWLRLTYPGTEVELLNLGLPSETVSGLSEPGHAGGAFPRPGVHERLGRVLEKARPDLIVACYGMNDGIYYPWSEERAKAFQDSMRRLRERAAHQGVRVLHVTPPVFDPIPILGRTLPAGLAEYPSPYRGYNEVLDRYSEWLVAQRKSGWEVVDAHGPMNRVLDGHRRTDPKFLLAGDGVHANTQGNWLIAREFLRHLGAPSALVSSETPDALVKSHPHGVEVLKLVQRRQRGQKDAWLTHVGHVRPGMSKGKPLAEADREAAAVAEELRALR